MVVSDDLSNRLNAALGSVGAGQEHVAFLNAAANAAAVVVDPNGVVALSRLRLLAGYLCHPVADVAQAVSAQTQTALTNNTGGAVSTTLAAITAPAANATTSLTADMTAAKNAVASLAAELALIKTDIALLVTLANALRTACITNNVIKGSA
jgi:hypothetical protein